MQTISSRNADSGPSLPFRMIIRAALLALLAGIAYGLFSSVHIVGLTAQRAKANRNLPTIPLDQSEAPAVEELKKINTAEVRYFGASTAHNGFACSLADLAAGDPRLIDSTLTTGTKADYIFTVSCGPRVKIAGADLVSTYIITAVPQEPGNRGFCIADDGVIRFDPKGGPHCTEQLQ